MKMGIEAVGECLKMGLEAVGECLNVGLEAVGECSKVTLTVAHSLLVASRDLALPTKLLTKVSRAVGMGDWSTAEMVPAMTSPPPLVHDSFMASALAYQGQLIHGSAILN